MVVAVLGWDDKAAICSPHVLLVFIVFKDSSGMLIKLSSNISKGNRYPCNGGNFQNYFASNVNRNLL